MYKNKQFYLHKQSSNRFNKGKPINDDIARLQNIHKKGTPIQPLNFIQDKHIPVPEIVIHEHVYKINSFKTSTNISLNFYKDNDNNNQKNHKIHFKEIAIPIQNEHDIFYLNNINKTISTPIHMNRFIGDIFNEGDISRLKQKLVTTINHIYQEKYTHNINVTGFGDFIRGCFFLLQFCNKYGFKYNIIIQHPIAIFLQKYSSKFYISSHIKTILHNKNIMFTQSNLKDTIFNKNNNIDGFILSNRPLTDYVEYLCGLNVINNSIYSYNTLFPYDNISIKEKEYVKSMLEPTSEMKSYVDESIIQFGFTPTKFITIHIRSGDVYLKNETKLFDSQYFKILTNEIFQIVNREHTDILLIADNNEIKYFMCEIFPNIKTLYKDITHLGEGSELEREKVKNTLLDFYLLSNSSSIYSFTVYPHGTGFSYWCATIFDIPYTCKYIST